MSLHNSNDVAIYREYADNPRFDDLFHHTISIWHCPQAAAPSAQQIWVARGAGTVAGDFTMGTPASGTFQRHRASITTTSGLQTSQDTVDWLVNVWQHHCQTYDGVTLSNYVNGCLRTSSVPAGSYTQTTSSAIRLWMRTNAANPGNSFVEQLGIWRKPFTAAEVEALFHGADFTKFRREHAVILDPLRDPSRRELVAGLGVNTGIVVIREAAPIILRTPAAPLARPLAYPYPNFSRYVFAATAPPAFPDLAWGPRFPGQALGPLRPNQGPALAYGPAVDRWGLDSGQTPWRGVFPERVPAAPRPNAGPSFASGQAIHGVEGNKGWGALYPDRAPAPPRPVDGAPAFAAGQARHGVEGGQTGWQGHYPEAAPRRAPALVEHQAVAYVPAISRWGLDTLAWLPLFPDRVPAARRVVDAGFVALVQLVAPALTLGWYPQFPDAVLARAAPREYQQPSYAPAINRWGLDGVPWLPRYPDRLPAAPRPNVGPHWAGPTAPPALPIWWPHFPDFARQRPRAAEYLALGQSLLNFIAPPAPLGSWYPAFPDFARGERPRLQGGAAQALQHVMPLGSWYPVFPASVRAAARAQNTDPGQLLRTLAAIVNLDNWAPQYPDRIWAPRPPTPSGAAFVSLGAATPPPRGIGATYPDRTALPAQMPPSWFAQPLFAPGFAPPLLSWLGRFPEAVRGAAPRQQAGAVWAPDPTPRALSWLARYPDRLVRPVPFPWPGPSLVQLVAPPPPAPLLAWLSQFPDMARGPLPRWLVAQVVGLEPFFQLSDNLLAEFLYGPPAIPVLDESKTDLRLESSILTIVLAPFDE